MYSFFGAFAQPLMAGLDECFIQRWSDVDVVELSSPFLGLAVRFATSVYTPSDEDLPDPVSNGVQEISRQVPTVRFVLLRTECWGGLCGNWGQFIQSGRVVVNEPLLPGVEIARPEPDGILRRLINHLGVDIGPAEVFAPLTRDFPWKPGAAGLRETGQ